MNEKINKYIDKLLTSKPDKPLWNVEVSKYNKKLGWNYIDGCMISSIIELYKFTKDKKYLDFVTKFIDHYVDKNGNILGYDKEKYSTDDVCESKVLFDLYEFTKKEKYLKAIKKTFEQLKTHPRTKEGNFWHKKIYHDQIWLDGLYMVQPFYTRYQNKFGHKNYDDIVNQFKNVYKIMYDKKTGLYYHAYDSSKTLFWCDKKTGLSKNFWLRAIGWYTVALIDVYDYMDKKHIKERNEIRKIFIKTINGILKYQDKKSKMFYQVPNFPNKKGNYLETSGSSMIAYAVLKGSRLKLLSKKYSIIGKEIFEGIEKKSLSFNKGILNLEGICLMAGVGPEDNKRRDGSYKYYISEPIVKNDAKGVAPFIMAYVEYLKNEAN